ncbi:MAG: TatD family deoxyribonuclease [Desulfobulbaceae bacterium]|nr:MAG: TatD family deoxyribonuclease [Desulfobulbaceae bacterium]
MTKQSSKTVIPRLTGNYSWVDTHCHLDFPDYQADLATVLADSRQVGVHQFVTVGVDLATSRLALVLAESQPGVYATVGVHPHHVKEVADGDYETLRELGSRPGVVAYGEIGLDYVKEYSPAALQREHFALQIEIAGDLNLPLIIHDREAHADTLAILRAAGPLPAGGVMHCFSGDAALAEAALDLGFYISIPGVITFKSETTLAEVVRQVPFDRLLLETDAPFLAPAPLRGERNEPGFLPYIGQKVAELKGSDLEEVAHHTTANACRLFRL